MNDIKDRRRKIVFVDMDNVLVDFASGLKKISRDLIEKFHDREDEIPGIFSRMDPLTGAIEAFNFLSHHFDTYILTTSPWENPTALQDKRDWVVKHLPKTGYKRMIITHHKNLCTGDYIIDDRTARGVDTFEGEHIHFGTGRFSDWNSVLDYLCEKENIKR
ncbi:MAG: hypothetical protein U5Q03_00165 [Bacteroidota bacterium]|nr:hypothetical protein [Bacteroidota bacterium]